MPAEVGSPCVTFLATLILSPERDGLHVWPLSRASEVMTQRGDRLVLVRFWEIRCRTLGVFGPNSSRNYLRGTVL